MTTAVAFIAFAVAGVAAAWPVIASFLKARPADAGGIDRADWVNRLFPLAEAAEASGDAAVAAAARALIAALVAQPEPAKRGK